METTEKPKRTYQKHKTEKKFTIKHYLNTYNKEVSDVYDFPLYPVYAQVTYNRRSTRFKTKIQPVTDSEFLENAIPFDEGYLEDYYFNESRKEFDNELARDVDFIQWLANNCIKITDNFPISILTNLYNSNAFSLTEFTEWCLKEEIREKIFDIRGFTNEERESDFTKYTAIPLFSKASALDCLEFYLRKYPTLIELRQKYNSQIWLLKIFIEKGNESSMLYGFPMFASLSQNGEFGLLQSQEPTLQDYNNHIFQKRFLESFDDKEQLENTLNDLELIFEKFYNVYIDMIFQNHIKWALKKANI